MRCRVKPGRTRREYILHFDTPTFLTPNYSVLNALQKVVINQMQRPSKPTTIYAYFILKACETAPISRGAINEPIKLMLERMVNAMLTGVFDFAPTKL